MDLKEQVEYWRQKQRDGTLTIDELRQAISTMREGRATAVASSKKASKPIFDPDTLLKDLDL